VKLAISNIAWDPDDDAAVAKAIRQAGGDGVELAPTKLWPSPDDADAAAVRRVRDWWAAQGIGIVALQALLFGRSDLRLFSDGAGQRALLDHLQGWMAVATGLGATVLVFGSPKNRSLPPGETGGEARARDFFARLAAAAVEAGLVIGLEANPLEYGCNFLTTAKDVLGFVKSVDHPGLAFHADTACAEVAGEDLAGLITTVRPAICHVHLSRPQLGAVGLATGPSDEAVVQALRGIGYDGYVSVEMRPDEAGSVVAVERALSYTAGLLQRV
jgi:D-psicose/D-tagatose/L-ribulose 3-epimerase